MGLRNPRKMIKTLLELLNWLLCLNENKKGNNMSIVNLSAEYFGNPNTGKPVALGYVYIGEPDLDPEIAANRKTVTFRLEDGTEITASQPLRTGAGGYITYNGSTPVALVSPDYSVKVLDSNMSQVLYVPSADDGSIAPTPTNGGDGIGRWSTQTLAYIAERGLSNAAPENTTQALQLAGDSGLWGSMFGVRLTSDEAWVLMEDETVDRTTDGAGLVSALTLAAIQALDAGTWFNSYYAGSIVPTLQEALNVCRSTNQKTVIDIKGAGYSDAQMQNLIDAANNTFPNGGYLILSETLGNIQQVRDLDTSAGLVYKVTGYSTAAVDECVTLTNCDLAVFYNNVTDITYAHDNDVSVIAFTVEFQNDIDDMNAQGVAAVTTTRLRQRETPRDQFVIDLRRLDWTTLVPETASDNTNFSIDESSQEGEFLVNSFTTLESIIASWIPNKLAIGARVEVSADIRSVGGSQMQLYIDSFADSAYGGLNGTGGTLEAQTTADASTEYRNVSANYHVRPDSQYVRAAIGFKAPLVGNAYFRNLKITVDGADIVKNHPSSLTRTESQTYDIYKLANQLTREEVAPGTVTENPTNLTFSAPTTASVSQVYFGDSNVANNHRTSFNPLDLTEGVEIVLKAQAPGNSCGMIAMDYYFGDGAFVDTLKCYFIIDGGYQRLFFPSIPGADNGRLRIGADTSGTIQSTFSVEYVGMSLLNTMKPDLSTGLQPVLYSLRNDGAGVWVNEDDGGQISYNSSVVSGFILNSAYIDLELKPSINGFPQVHVQLVRNDNITDVNQIPYDVEVIFVSNLGAQYIRVAVFDKTTGLRIDHTTSDLQCSISVVGFFLR